MKIRRFHALKIIEWCRDQYGRSKYNKGILYLTFKKPDWSNEDLLGEYDSIENTIFINSIENYDHLLFIFKGSNLVEIGNKLNSHLAELVTH